jgi:hypothetical protein
LVVLLLAQHIPFAAVARVVGESAHREIACGLTDYRDVSALAIHETSLARGHDYSLKPERQPT